MSLMIEKGRVLFEIFRSNLICLLQDLNLENGENLFKLQVGE